MAMKKKLQQQHQNILHPNNMLLMLDLEGVFFTQISTRWRLKEAGGNSLAPLNSVNCSRDRSLLHWGTWDVWSFGLTVPKSLEIKNVSKQSLNFLVVSRHSCSTDEFFFKWLAKNQKENLPIHSCCLYLDNDGSQRLPSPSLPGIFSCLLAPYKVTVPVFSIC